MKAFAKLLVGAAVVGGGYAAMPADMRAHLPKAPWDKPDPTLQVVSLQEAMAPPREGYVTVTFLYMSNLPPQVASDLASDVKAWRKKGVAVRAFSIDPVPVKDDIVPYAKRIGLDVQPTWIEMPDGAECAFNQMNAVRYFTHRSIDPRVTIPLLTLALTDRDGNITNTHSIEVPNGGTVSLEQFNDALGSFDKSVRDAAKNK